MSKLSAEQIAEKNDFLEQIKEVLGSGYASASVENGELELHLTPDQLLEGMANLASSQALLFSMLIDVTAVDYPNRAPRFDLVYQLLSMQQNQRLRVKVALDEETIVPSVCEIWRSAGWFEREVWDMYGLMFSGHPDMRRILSDYGFDGHPLRKDFPLTGHVEVRYDAEQQRVVYEPVKLQQEYRTFDYASPWEGMSLEAPGVGNEQGDH